MHEQLVSESNVDDTSSNRSKKKVFLHVVETIKNITNHVQMISTERFPAIV